MSHFFFLRLLKTLTSGQVCVVRMAERSRKKEVEGPHDGLTGALGELQKEARRGGRPMDGDNGEEAQTSNTTLVRETKTRVTWQR